MIAPAAVMGPSGPILPMDKLTEAEKEHCNKSKASVREGVIRAFSTFSSGTASVLTLTCVRRSNLAGAEAPSNLRWGCFDVIDREERRGRCRRSGGLASEGTLSLCTG